MCLWYRLSVHCLFSFQKKKTWILKSTIKKIYSYLETFPFHRQANLQSEFSAEVFFIFDFCSFYSLKSSWFGVVFKCVIMKEAVAVFFNGYRIGLATLTQLLCPLGHKQTCSILSKAHISAPGCCLPPSQWTSHHLPLAQCRPFREQMFSCYWGIGQDRQRNSREQGKATDRLAAHSPPPICLPV